MRAPSSRAKPNTRSYNIAVNALSKCAAMGDESVVDRCISILQEMKASKKSKPDAFTYGSAISVFSKLAMREHNMEKRKKFVLKCKELYKEMLSKGIKSRIVSSMMQQLPGPGCFVCIVLLCKLFFIDT